MIRIGIPIVLGALFVWSLFDDLTREGGFLVDGSGRWIFPNCVGLSIMIIVPVAAVVVSLAKGRGRDARWRQGEAGLPVKGRIGGAVCLVLSLFSAVLLVILLRMAVGGGEERGLLWLSLPPAVLGVAISNYLLDRYNSSATRASWFARWAGMAATVDVGAFIALNLIYSTKERGIASSIPHHQDHLSGISYLILSVVFLLIIGGLGWCFYRALSVVNEDAGMQRSGEIGDQVQQ